MKIIKILLYEINLHNVQKKAKKITDTKIGELFLVKKH